MYRKGQKIKMTCDCANGGFKRGDVFTLTRDHELRAVFVDNDGDYRSRSYGFEPLPVAAEAQPAAPLKIEAGKFYRTRDGRKVGNIHKDFGYWFGNVVGESGTRAFEPDGKHGNEHIPNNPDLDLIAEWQDTPAAPVAAQIDAIAEEYGPAPQQEPDTTLHIKFTSDFSELDAAILVRKKKLEKLINLARKAGIELREAA